MDAPSIPALHAFQHALLSGTQTREIRKGSVGRGLNCFWFRFELSSTLGLIVLAGGPNGVHFGWQNVSRFVPILSPGHLLPRNLLPRNLLPRNLWVSERLRVSLGSDLSPKKTTQNLHPNFGPKSAIPSFATRSLFSKKDFSMVPPSFGNYG